MSTLHEELLARIRHVERLHGLNQHVLVAPLRAVVELHAPGPHRLVPAVLWCGRCDLPADQCVEVRAIASAMGVEIGDTPK